MTLHFVILLLGPAVSQAADVVRPGRPASLGGLFYDESHAASPRARGSCEFALGGALTAPPVQPVPRADGTRLFAEWSEEHPPVSHEKTQDEQINSLTGSFEDEAWATADERSPRVGDAFMGEPGLFPRAPYRSQMAGTRKKMVFSPNGGLQNLGGDVSCGIDVSSVEECSCCSSHAAPVAALPIGRSRSIAPLNVNSLPYSSKSPTAGGPQIVNLGSSVQTPLQPRKSFWGSIFAHEHPLECVCCVPGRPDILGDNEVSNPEGRPAQIGVGVKFLRLNEDQSGFREETGLLPAQQAELAQQQQLRTLGAPRVPYEYAAEEVHRESAPMIISAADGMLETTGFSISRAPRAVFQRPRLPHGPTVFMPIFDEEDHRVEEPVAGECEERSKRQDQLNKEVQLNKTPPVGGITVTVRSRRSELLDPEKAGFSMFSVKPETTKRTAPEAERKENSMHSTEPGPEEPGGGSSCATYAGTTDFGSFQRNLGSLNAPTDDPGCGEPWDPWDPYCLGPTPEFSVQQDLPETGKASLPETSLASTAGLPPDITAHAAPASIFRAPSVGPSVGSPRGASPRVGSVRVGAGQPNSPGRTIRPGDRSAMAAAIPSSRAIPRGNVLAASGAPRLPAGPDRERSPPLTASATPWPMWGRTFRQSVPRSPTVFVEKEETEEAASASDASSPRSYVAEQSGAFFREQVASVWGAHIQSQHPESMAGGASGQAEEEAVISIEPLHEKRPEDTRFLSAAALRAALPKTTPVPRLDTLQYLRRPDAALPPEEAMASASDLLHRAKLNPALWPPVHARTEDYGDSPTRGNSSRTALNPGDRVRIHRMPSDADLRNGQAATVEAFDAHSNAWRVTLDGSGERRALVEARNLLQL